MRHNRYFDDKVQSLGFSDAVGDATVGVIEPGEYAFGTSQRERMTVVAGALRYRLPGQPWLAAGPGETFEVPAGVTFEVKAEGQTAYLCRYG
ncbi:MAG: pyrimidine/purine nucleoside phosphorylase [Thermodesulfobacteriota bacterium]